MTIQNPFKHHILTTISTETREFNSIEKRKKSLKHYWLPFYATEEKMKRGKITKHDKENAEEEGLGCSQ
jgi:hypothetical protein